MGRNKRVGRDRDNGPDPLARLAPPEPSTQPWGVTGMPSWLDTPAGRDAWAARDAEPAEAAAPPTPAGNDDPDWRPSSETEDTDWFDNDWDGDDEQSASDGELPGLESLGDDDEWEDDWEPPRRRLTMLPPAAIGLIVVGLIACAIAGYSLLKQNEPTAPVVAFDAAVESAEPGRPSSGTVPSASASSTAPDGRIIVSVVGLVRKPGLVRIVDTARVADAIAQAGGARPGADLISLNMAQLLHDGDQILVGQGDGGSVKSAVVPASGASGGEPSGGAPPGAGGSLPADGTGLVNLNTATAEQLDTLPGVGPVTAEAIIAWRQANGKFTSVEQLAEVDGIGPARLAKLKPLVTVG
ncbi:ComEA family DNA-binding protein [Gordonia phthalatica]|uniref:DNA-binding protein n=1 Tax=Gordonia phthalatica TaxID=1136941 RepID=A0A0N9N860_9ACTN|nr:ComEA family DNA-binding protein [Gordonia phthalatica]ALG86897.1 DNA-binding protein [Gordonia phthalatica]